MAFKYERTKQMQYDKGNEKKQYDKFNMTNTIWQMQCHICNMTNPIWWIQYDNPILTMQCD